MRDLLRDLVLENRSILGPGYDRALARVGEEVSLDVHEVPSGTKVWTWTVPDAWDVSEAWFAADGERFADFERHPLHVWSYSLPFKGKVSKEELLRHLTTRPDRPSAIPFDFRYYERDWGFSLEHNRLESLTADEYEVVIDARHFPGALKIGEHVIAGSSTDSVLIVTHLDHPGQANDDLAGVAVSTEVARRLAGRPLNRTHRFLYLPEHVGSTAYLATREEEIPTFRFGVFLEMLGIDQQLALQHSRNGDTQVDYAFQLALTESGHPFVEGRFLEVIANDEQVMDGPGVGIPTISLSRARPAQTEGVDYPEFHTALPYPQYHTSDDSLEIIVPERLDEAATVVVRALEILDQDAYPRRLYRGTVQLSSYGLWVDWRVDPRLNERIDRLMWSFEGDRPLSAIALELDLEFDVVREYVKRFVAAGLVELSSRPVTP
jgi:aminopeptidase-like protein